MHTIDILLACAAAVVVVIFAAVLARQRFMLQVAGAIPIAIQVGGRRWVYGVGRYVGGELRWYRAIGVGTRPTIVLHRKDLRVVNHRPPHEDELASLPATAIIVHCSNGSGSATFGFSEGAFTGFVSWLEASAPKS